MEKIKVFIIENEKVITITLQVVAVVVAIATLFVALWAAKSLLFFVWADVSICIWFCWWLYLRYVSKQGVFFAAQNRSHYRAP